jgi:hypothetical protein
MTKSNTFPKRIILTDGMSTADYNLYVQQNITEETWQQQVVNRCHECGWKAVHINRAKLPIKARQQVTERERAEGMRWLTAVSGDGVGWPDTFVGKTLRIGRSVFMVWELKSYGKRATSEQLWWLDFFRHVPGCLDASVRYPWELDDMTVLLNRD